MTSTYRPPDRDSNLVKARSSIVWILAIVVAFGSVLWIERESGKELIAKAAGPGATAPAQLQASPDLPPPPAARPLTEEERRWAQAAWAYFERNTETATGLAHSVAGFPATTLWDSGSYLMALLAARQLDLVDAGAFDARLSLALGSLAKLPLYGGVLPNKSYDTRTLAMTDYQNRPSAGGIGWSAIDIGRLLVPLNIVAWQHPRHTEAARRVIARWNTAGLARDGQLWGMQAQEGTAPQALQEGRLGYEQYAARTFALMGLDVDVAANWLHQLRWIDVEGVQVPADRREVDRFGAPDPVLSEPFMLEGMELGWGRHGRELAWRVYKAQEARARRTGIPTAVSEDHLDQAPFFAYNAVHAAGKPWIAVNEKGEELPGLRTLSVKAAFAWHALYRTPYTQTLVKAVAGLHDPARGWFAGRYEEAGRANEALSANTNAVVLESLAFMQRGGPLLHHSEKR